MRLNIAKFAIVFLFLVYGAASAHEYKIGNLTIDHPYAFETPKRAKTAAGYLSVTNAGKTSDRLIAIRSEYPHTMLHQTNFQDGIARMEHVDALDIAPGETVTLKPGGTHIMFMGIEEDSFMLGNKVPVTLVFDVAGEIEVLLAVQKRVDEGAMEDQLSQTIVPTQ